MSFLTTSRRALVAVSRSNLIAARSMAQQTGVDKELRQTILDSKPSQDNENGITGRIPDNFEQATGLERAEMIEMAKGNNDPFGLEGLKWGPPGTAAAPREIPSHVDERVVGCCCNPESELITYFTLKAGEAQACPCAQQHFKLVKVPVDQISW